jgi:hypothetical protein
VIVPVALLALIVCSILSGCVDDAPQLLFDEPYAEWTRTVEEPITYPIPGHGENRRVIYINEIGKRVLPVSDSEDRISLDYPEGTIVLKENYDDVAGTNLRNLTIMIKSSDDTRARSGWIWINKDARTGAEMVFNDSTFCITCHTAANEPHPYGDGNPQGEYRDYLFFPYRPAP